MLAARDGNVECLKELLAAGAEKAPCTLCWCSPKFLVPSPGSCGDLLSAEQLAFEHRHVDGPVSERD